MAGFRILLSCSVGLLVYFLLSLFLSSYGIDAYNELDRYTDALETNVAELAAIRDRLKSEAVALRSDPESIRLRARELGYIEQNEGIIRVSGMTSERATTSPGKVMRRITKHENLEPLLRGISLSAAILSLLLTFFFLPRKN